MASSDEVIPVTGDREQVDNGGEAATVNRLHTNALGLPALLFVCVAAIAPAASMLFNVPVMASQAGAATPLAFVLSAVGVLLLGVPVVYFARHLSSAGGFATWVRHGLGRGAAFQVGWLMLGAYALFEAALQATVGGSLASLLLPLGVTLPGGWVLYALVLTLIVGILSYFDIRASIWVMAPFAVAEVLALLILDAAITVKGGAAGHDLVHTFTPAGANLAGVAPGGTLGIGIAMVLGILAFVGFETGAVYGEEARHPHRTIPVAIFSLLVFLAVLYTWTSYAATIGVGWQHAGSVLGNVNIAPQQYVTLAGVYVGRWLGVALIVFVITSNFASSFAMHQAMVRYTYSMGREGILPHLLGKTHPRWKSPFIATFLQSGFTGLLILFLGLVMQHTNPDGSVSYALGIANGTFWQQTSGIVSFGWLASIVTICIILVYILTNIAAPFFARRRGELRLFPHIIAPAVSTLLLLLPLGSYLLPALPGSPGAFFTHLGFAPTPFPANILPLFVLFWVIVGLLVARYVARVHPDRYERLGRIRQEGE
ncbi:MAG: APC family permease [Ktedonobacteraceae bacterium]